MISNKKINVQIQVWPHWQGLCLLEIKICWTWKPRLLKENLFFALQGSPVYKYMDPIWVDEVAISSC
jgi:hypothetical protein